MSIFNKILLTIAAFILIGSLYLYSSNNFSFKTEKVYGGYLFSSKDLGSSDVIRTENISFISTLAVLHNIKIDNSLFTSQLFLNLKDNRVIIDPTIPGRANPFAPINSN